MKKNTNTLATAGKVLRYLRHYRLLFALSLLLAIVVTALTLYLPILTGEAIDLIIAPGQVDFEALSPLLLLGVIIIAITALCQWLMNICNNRITFGVVRRLRRDAFVRIQSLPLSYLDRRPVGDTVSRVITDADQVTEGLLMGFSQFFTGILTILGTLCFMLTLNLPMTVWVVVATPLSLFVASFIARKTHHLFKKQSEIRAEQTSLVDEMIGSHKVVVAFAHEDEALRDFEEINTRLENTSRKAVFFSSLVNPSTRFVNNLVYAGVALIGALICLSPAGGMALTVGGLSAFLTYAGQYTKPFNEISGVVTELQNAMACAARLFELIEAETETPDAPDATVLSDVEGSVALTDVAFSYTPDKELIRDLNLTLKSGQRVAIVGPTGCGKTTVINLLMRFYDKQSGVITVDGHEITDLTRDSLRRAYTMVLQDTWLFCGTVYDNIVYGTEGADMEAVVKAAKAAHIHDFIESLPEGYMTVLSDDGINVSKGQKQLLTIARAMLSDAPILILDEATSNVDSRTEKLIQDALYSLMKGRTCFVIAHRLSTIKNADLILVMKDGNVIESGNHEELLAKQGFYSKLYESGINTAV